MDPNINKKIIIDSNVTKKIYAYSLMYIKRTDFYIE